MRGPMPANRLLIAAALLAACATPERAPEPDGADRLDAEVTVKVREGRDQGFPNLSDVPARGATPEDARALGAEAETLEAEAAALRALRAEANAPRPPSDLPERAAQVRRDVARARADIAAQPPLERPTR